ncbi:hypothetical protein [Catenuloplanes japonicus]|uniref:hypothetical protein n=1 Tax=Catenuloplanes japonicus TaxID=33876 RepID=UPI00068D2753|nr:hypothetical protein [Catenuloplanes japonicus]
MPSQYSGDPATPYSGSPGAPAPYSSGPPASHSGGPSAAPGYQQGPGTSQYQQYLGGPASPPGYQQFLGGPAAPPQGYGGFPPPQAPPPGYGPPGYGPPGAFGPPGTAPVGYLQTSGRPYAGDAPGFGPVILFTAIFGILGALSASRRARRAREMGAPTQKYWVAFGLTLLAQWLLFGIIQLATSGGEAVTSTSLEQSIVREGDFVDRSGAPVTVTGATCVATDVDSDGAGRYDCMLDFNAGGSQAFEVTADASGTWVTKNPA